ncbi:MAG: DUF3995 domain-containing protein [Arcobacteraceae bacterium]|nr:DUF3995 domain-containing protein [Arcobacteraceae bacterium]
MYFLTITTITLLLIMSLFHIYWALGGKVGLDKALPTKDGVQLLNPSKALTFLVGVVLFGFASVAYSLYFWVDNSELVVYLGWIIAVLFFVRAIGEFHIVGFFKKIKDTPFAEYDTKYFSPLCLFLSVVFALLLVKL